MIEEFVGGQKSAKLSMAEFDISVVSKVGTELCAACYDLKEYSSFILSSYINVFKRLKFWMNSVDNNQEGYYI